MDRQTILRIVFFTIFTFALFVGTLAYMFSSEGGDNPIQYMLNLSGFGLKDAQNQKSMQALSETASEESMRVHQRMEEVTQQQNDFLNATKDRMDQERQDAQDQQKINQQRQEEQMQQMRDMQQMQNR